ncbi:MAG: hypothetical protein FWG07_02875 [Treponema sp.]|nr:hypothetical protein [Treponema sp.]
MALKKIAGNSIMDLPVSFTITDEMLESGREHLEANLRAHGWTGKSKRDRDDEIRQGLKNSTASKKRKKSKED